jgi:hypothetical protein
MKYKNEKVTHPILGIGHKPYRLSARILSSRDACGHNSSAIWNTVSLAQNLGLAS